MGLLLGDEFKSPWSLSTQFKNIDSLLPISPHQSNDIPSMIKEFLSSDTWKPNNGFAEHEKMQKESS
tara:strand:+ start:1823 stop:2023 length:201 start_codon:yes stop_codon:yes gene_type:complete